MAKILILMSTYNGEKYLETQIESLLQQKSVDLDILVRDDGSKDTTTEILEKYQKQGVLKWYQGENLRPAKSFLDLLYHCPRDYDYYAFCDQDDFWLPEKMISAVNKLSDQPEVPSLYFCDLQIVNSTLEPIGEAHNYRKGVQIPQMILAYSIPGCTMVMNRMLHEQIIKYQPDPDHVTMHDCWTYYICAYTGGRIIGDSNCLIKYRQHGQNSIGAVSIPVKQKIKMIKGNGTAPRGHMIKQITDLYHAEADPKYQKYFESYANYYKKLSCKTKFLFMKKTKFIGSRQMVKAKLMVLFNSQ